MTERIPNETETLLRTYMQEPEIIAEPVVVEPPPDMVATHANAMGIPAIAQGSMAHTVLSGIVNQKNWEDTPISIKKRIFNKVLTNTPRVA